MSWRRWTDEEDDWLRKNYPELGAKGCWKIGRLHRTWPAIRWRASKLGVQYVRTDKKQAHCIDCGAEICYKATRCRPCAGIMRWERGDYDDVDMRYEFTEEARQKTSVGVQAAWKRGDYEGRAGVTEEIRQKISEGVKVAWNRGDFEGVLSSESARRNQSEAAKTRWANGVYDGVFQSPTSIELQIAAALDILGIEHTPQYRPDGYSRIYDEFIPPSVFIEIQGDYWHGPNFPEHQQRDAEKAQWAEDNGFELITIWEHEIKERGAWAIIAQRFNT